ncbi:YncE family protein [Sulfurisphaera ohwakuensis]|uniref:YncE family protein n=1 Tax=Sulfurisphaera ohwakuensis TaxID=69656 RepID=UPI0036F25777
MKKRSKLERGMSYKILLLVGIVVILLIGIGAAYIMMKSPSTTTSTTTSSPSSSATVSSSSAPSNNFYLLVFTQKGIVQAINPFTQTSNFLGFQHVVNISTSVPQQVYYWDEVPAGEMFNASYIVIPVNNGSVYIINPTTLKVVETLSVGKSVGFIGVAYSPNQQYVAIADGPSGVVEIINLKNLQVVWKDTFVSPTGKTYYPCDVRWTSNGEYLIVPMRFNNTVDLISASNGSVVKMVVASLGSQPYMVSPNMQGTMVAVEYAGNDSVGFYSLPNLQYMGMVQMPSGITPQRGVFTPNGQYYLEAPSNKNEVVVISTSNFQITQTISLPSINPQGLADIGITPGESYAYVVMHGSVSSGGMIVLINLQTLSVAYEVPLTTAPAFILPVSVSTATYLVDNVLLPPITGLHC